MKYNYFYISGNFIHQIMETVMGTHAEVVHKNHTYGYLEALILILNWFSKRFLQ